MNSFLSFIITLVILSLLRKWKMILPLLLELYFLQFTVRKWLGEKKQQQKLLLEISKEPEERTWSFSSNDGHRASLCHLLRAHVISSVQFSHSVMSSSLQPHEPQHTRPPCPSRTSGVYPDSCPLNQWCHPTISPSVIPFSSCPQSFPASGSFQMSQLFAWGGQSIGVSASTSVLPMNTQDWSHFEWTGWILQSKGLSRVFSNTTVQKHQFLGA